MSKPLWISLAIAAVGSVVMYGAGCGSSNSNNNDNGGGACCLCASTSCGTSRTLAPAAGTTVSSCATFCQANYQGTCAGASASTVTGLGVSCPSAEGGVPVNDAGIDRVVTSPDGGTINASNFNVKCMVDADCGGGLQCLSDLGGGASFPNGICSLSCSSTNNPCTSLNAVCVTFTTGTPGICIESCDLGVPGSLTAAKCQARPDEACQPVNFNSATSPVTCMPTCTSDDDCPGKSCDPSLGVCIAGSTPSPIGAPCTADATGASNDCGDGVCAPVEDTDGGPARGFCTAFCSLGGLDSCGYTRNALTSGGHAGVCAFPLFQNSLVGDGTGDIGFCGQLCDQQSDCSLTFPGWVCAHDTGTVMQFNHGLCVSSGDADAGITPPATDAGAE
jgi:hypothetical protein